LNESLKGDGYMHNRWVLLLSLFGFVLFSSRVFAESDLIYEKCTNQKTDPAPWCYQREVERIGNPDLCENILQYWPKADGVHGWCFFQIALKNKDCSLCDRIQKGDIRKLCIREVCRQRK
jgi:hypothetical protein